MEFIGTKIMKFFFVLLCLISYGNCSFEKMFEQGILDQPAGTGKILIQSELEIETLYMPEDCTNKAKDGDTVVLDFEAWMNDEEFETSKDTEEGPGEKLIFTIGKHLAIAGLEQGVRGMCLGEKRKLVVPPHLAFGAKGVPNLVPGLDLGPALFIRVGVSRNLVGLTERVEFFKENAVAKFELELLEIVPKSWGEWYIDMIQIACVISFVAGMISLLVQTVQNRNKQRRRAERIANHED